VVIGRKERRTRQRRCEKDKLWYVAAGRVLQQRNRKIKKKKKKKKL